MIFDLRCIWTGLKNGKNISKEVFYPFELLVSRGLMGVRNREHRPKSSLTSGGLGDSIWPGTEASAGRRGDSVFRTFSKVLADIVRKNQPSGP